MNLEKASLARNAGYGLAAKKPRPAGTRPACAQEFVKDAGSRSESL